MNCITTYRFFEFGNQKCLVVFKYLPHIIEGNRIHRFLNHTQGFVLETEIRNLIAPENLITDGVYRMNMGLQMTGLDVVAYRISPEALPFVPKESVASIWSVEIDSAHIRPNETGALGMIPEE